MRRKLVDLVLWLFVIDLGIALGAGLYEHRVVISAWAGTPPSTWPNTGLLFWAYVTTVPLTLLTLVNAVVAWRQRGPERRWWLAAVGVVLVERLATFAYFIPTMVALQALDQVPQAEIDAALSRWLSWNVGRHLLSLAGFLFALKALATRRA